MADQNTRTITAHNLLHGFLDLRGLTPDMGDWSSERLSGNPPRLFRLQQLIAMFRAFGIDWNPVAFVEGKFIRPESTRYAALLGTMASAMPEAARPAFRVDRSHLPDCFKILFRYRERLEAVLSFSSGVLAASGLYGYAYFKVADLNRIIYGNVAIVDDILIALISPEAKVFVVDQMARDYGYPDVDLVEIDLDWW